MNTNRTVKQEELAAQGGVQQEDTCGNVQGINYL